MNIHEIRAKVYALLDDLDAETPELAQPDNPPSLQWDASPTVPVLFKQFFYDGQQAAFKVGGRYLAKGRIRLVDGGATIVDLEPVTPGVSVDGRTIHIPAQCIAPAIAFAVQEAEVFGVHRRDWHVMSWLPVTPYTKTIIMLPPAHEPFLRLPTC